MKNILLEKISKDEIFKIAANEYNRYKHSPSYIERLEFGRIVLPLNGEGDIISAVALIYKGVVKEIELTYIDGTTQTVRPD